MSEINGTIFFMDGTKMTLKWPRKTEEATTISSRIKAALELDKLMVEVDGDMLIIPMRNIKYIQITPAPITLPEGVIRGAKVVY
jgi:hypothetical protein